MMSRRHIFYILCATACIFLAACTSTAVKQDKEVRGQDSEGTGVTYDMEVTAVVKQIDTDKSTMTLVNTEYQNEVTLSYTNGTAFYNKYDKMITESQIELGEIIDVGYESGSSTMKEVRVNKEAFSYESADKYNIDTAASKITVAGKKYKFDDNLQVTSDEVISLMDVNSQDALTFRGFDKQILSVHVAQGHGYILPENYDAFVGGTIEIGRGIILPITKNMMIVAREGFYNVKLTNGDLVSNKTIKVYKDKETVLDMSDVKVNETRKGSVTFIIEPDGALLYINDVETDYTKAVTLNYGRHKIVVRLNGYDTYSGYLNVQDEKPVIYISLVDQVAEVSDSESSKTSNAKATAKPSGGTSTPGDSTSTSAPDPTSTPSESSSSVEKDDSADNKTSAQMDAAHRITIAAPEGVEVYFDDVYKGLSPCSFTKQIGSFTVSLRKEGYTTRSYTVDIADDSKDVSLSFAELVKESN